MSKTKKAVCFGETLWDIFPDMERIGGAPLNVASRLSSMGIETAMISQVGDDEKGKDLIAYLDSKNINTSAVVTSNEFKTGEVQVKLSASGSATYEITHPSAWDRIEGSEIMTQLVEKSDAFIYGSLVCRDEVSRKTLFELLPRAKNRILDLNLRPPHYSLELLEKLMEYADFIKFNDDELFEIAESMGSPYHSLEQNLFFMAVKYPKRIICVTLGRHGAVLLKDKKLYSNNGYKVKVKDTVGAGDSFLGTLIGRLLLGDEPKPALDMACAVGAIVAAKEGANPEISNELINRFMDPMNTKK
ncbi:carbohydrate kinase [Christiangramia fulva]|uniref:Carbohydrate kinase n=1 Tax=Christiangramia fulva TaxID=2126553 RepID=A0A2R3Z4E6_9FLAO|nr:carbohydrate kinase [Christiangramia fulva]AVR45153.1 carbohydrate kinase [Christiangramia fulva]